MVSDRHAGEMKLIKAKVIDRLAFINLVTGIAVVIIFLLTGQYLEYTFNEEVERNFGFRMMRNSRHIYILLSGLINAAIGIYLTTSRIFIVFVLQVVATLFTVSASVLFILGFFTEVYGTFAPTPKIHWGTYLLLAGIFLHFIGKIIADNKRNN